MTAGKYNFTIEQGTTLVKCFTYEDASGNPINLSGYSANFDVWNSTDGSSIVSLTEEPADNGDCIDIEGVVGKVTVSISAVSTQAMNFDNARYVLKLTAGTGAKVRLLEGSIAFSKENSCV